MRPGDDVDRNHFTHTLSGRGAGIGSGLNRSYIASNQDRHQAGADLFPQPRVSIMPKASPELFAMSLLLFTGCMLKESASGH